MRAILDVQKAQQFPLSLTTQEQFQWAYMGIVWEPSNQDPSTSLISELYSMKYNENKIQYSHPEHRLQSTPPSSTHENSLFAIFQTRAMYGINARASFLGIPQGHHKFFSLNILSIIPESNSNSGRLELETYVCLGIQYPYRVNFTSPLITEYHLRMI